MTLRQLIELLEHIEKEHGDLPIYGNGEPVLNESAVTRIEFREAEKLPETALWHPLPKRVYIESDL